MEFIYHVLDVWTLIYYDVLTWAGTLAEWEWLVTLNGGGVVAFLWWRSSGPSGPGPRWPFKRRNPLYNFKNKREPGPFKQIF